MCHIQFASHRAEQDTHEGLTIEIMVGRDLLGVCRMDLYDSPLGGGAFRIFLGPEILMFIKGGRILLPYSL